MRLHSCEGYKSAQCWRPWCQFQGDIVICSVCGRGLNSDDTGSGPVIIYETLNREFVSGVSSISKWALKHSVPCKIWGFRGDDYEECRLLGYKNPVRTSQETHYVSATKSSRSMLCKIWGFHGSDYEDCRLLEYKNPVRTSQETHYFSTTESSRLMLCKTWGVHDGDYEDCRLLGYKNPVRTSQETHYFSTTELSQLMLCKFWGFHGSDCEEWRLPGCYAVCRFLQEPHDATPQKTPFFILSLAQTVLVYSPSLTDCTFCPKRNKGEQEAIAFLAPMRSFYTF
jgi:hypothetical protein